MKRTLKILGFAGAGALLVFAVALFIFYRLLQVGEFRQFLIAEFEQQSGLKVTVGEARVEIGRSMGVALHDFVLTEPQSDRPLMAAPKVLIRVAFLPLLQRKLSFHALRISQPTLHVDRDNEGRVPMAELVVNLPFHPKAGGQVSLDLREIRIDRGSVVFNDHLGGREAVVTRLREMDLHLRRARARVVAGPVSRGSAPASESAQAGIDFRWKAIVARDGREGDLAMKGKAVFPAGSFDLRGAWLDVELSAESVPAAMLSSYFPRPAPATSARGRFGHRLRWQGRLSEGARLDGEVRLHGVEIDTHGLFPDVLALGDGRIELTGEWRPQELHLERLDFQSKGLRFSAQGVVREPGGGDPYVDLRLAAPFTAVGTARRYLSTAMIDSQRLQAFTAAVTVGEVRLESARFTGRLSELRRLSEPGHEQRLSVHAEFRDVGGSLAGDSSLPLRGFSGRLVLEKGALHYRNLKGTVGQSRLGKIEGSHTGIFSKRGALDLSVVGEVDLAQLPELAKLGLVPSAGGALSSALQGAAGKGKLNLRLQTDFASLPRYRGALVLDGARVGFGDVFLTQVKGEVILAPGELRLARATALFAGSPVQIRALLKLPVSADPGSFDLTMDSAGVKASEALHVLLDLDPAPGPGTLRGSLRYYGSLAPAGQRTVGGALELIGAQVPLKVFAQPLREVHGRVRVEGKTVELQSVKGQLAGYPFSFNGRWTAGEAPELAFELTAPQMDVAHLLPKAGTGEADWYERFRARGKIAIDRGRYRSFIFSGLRTGLTVDRKTWRLENFFARSDGGTVRGGGAFADADKPAIVVNPDIEGVPLKTLLGWLDIEQTEVVGRASVKGTFEFVGATGAERKRNVDGAFQLRVEDGMARRLRLLVRVISLLDLTRWFSLRLPDLTQEGIHFRSVTADLKVLQGVYATENLLVDSDELRISGAGTLDGPKSELNFLIAVRPFPGLETAVNYIPLIGRGLAAIKNSLLVASFNVRGPLDDPTITPAPLGTLSEFFFGALAIPKSLMAPAPDGKK